jgi:hypothetical protein
VFTAVSRVGEADQKEMGDVFRLCYNYGLWIPLVREAALQPTWRVIAVRMVAADVPTKTE